MCRNYDAGECVEEGCTRRITCHDFTDQRCVEHSFNGRGGDRWLEYDDMPRDETLARFEALSPEPTRGPSNEMVRFPSELIAEAAKLAHEDGKSTSTWIRDLVKTEIFIRKHRLTWTLTQVASTIIKP